MLTIPTLLVLANTALLAGSFTQKILDNWKSTTVQKIESVRPGAAPLFFPPPSSVSVRVGSSSDDAEQNLASGAVSLNSTDLELAVDVAASQLVGLRFNNIAIPKGAMITSAYVEFETDVAWNTACNLNIQGQAADNPTTFTLGVNNLSSRSKTAASVAWSPAAWNTLNEKHQTPSLTSIVQEIVNRGGWASGNSMVIFVSGTGTREAESWDGEATAAPLLVVNFSDVQEICNNGLDDDVDGFTDCEDPDCRNISLSTPNVSACIDQPLQDVATVSVDVSWTNAPANDTIEVSIYGQTKRINVAGGASSPQTVTFTVPANGSTNNSLTAHWRNDSASCPTTTTFNAPAACSNDFCGCNILYLCGQDKPYDGDGWDHGLIAYLDEVNGANTVTPVLTKADASGMGTYDPMNQSTDVTVNLNSYGLVVVSATTEGHISSALVSALKDFSGSVLNTNYTIINDLGLSASEGSYQHQSHLFTDNATSKAIYNFNNDINPNGSKVFTRGNYTTAADAFLWTNAGEQAAGTNGVFFSYLSSDVLSGVAAGHGDRVYLGYHMNGLYSNAQNGGVLPTPVENWFVPAKHLTLDGKYWLDMAILEATKSCNIEICNNGLDDDGNGLIDCDDDECSADGLLSISKTNPNNCPSLNNGQITITAGSPGLEFSINGGVSYQSSNVFNGLAPGNYYIRLRNAASGCYFDYPSNPYVLSGATCAENCTNGLDDDGDGLADCADSDCKPSPIVGTNVSICLGSSYVLTTAATGGSLPYTFVWDNGLGNGQNFTVNPLVTTTYHVTVTAASGCSAVDSVIVTVTTCPEDCTDGIDNDGDGLVDCDDPDCQAVGKPQLMWDAYSICPGSVFQEQVIFNDNNLQFPVYSIAQGPNHGNVGINGNGIFTYTPNNNSCQPDQFVYKVCNQATGCCDTASVFLSFGDGAAPTLVNVPADITIGCDVEIPVAPLVYGLDGCPGIFISFEETSTQPSDGACQNYEIQRTWTATDLCENSSSATQVITVQDVIAPEIFRVFTLSNGKKLAAGISANTSQLWKFVQFPANFSEKPLVFCQLVSDNEASAAAVRIRNVSLEGFEIKLRDQESLADEHANERVAWMAVEPGTLNDNSNFQAFGMGDVSSALKSVSFSPNFNGQVPVLLAQSQTANDSDPFYTRFTSLTANAVNVFLEEEKSFDIETTHANESLAALAMKAGFLREENDEIFAESGTVNVTENWTTVTLLRPYTKPVVLFGGMNAGGDPATIRVRNVTSQSFEAKIQEWDYLDGVHASTAAAYLVLEGSLPAESQSYCDGTAASLVPGVNLFATDNCDNQIAFQYDKNSVHGASGLMVTSSWSAVDDCGNATTITRSDTCTLASVRLKAYLHGALLGSNNGLMRDDLRKNGVIPLIEPFTGMIGFVHKGKGGGEAMDPQLLDAIGFDAIVDWVFVELRNGSASNEVFGTTACLLQRDGDVVTPDGDSILYFLGQDEGNYFVTVKHRNHLGMMSKNFEYLSAINPPLLDFRSSALEVNGNESAGLASNGKRSLWAGDFNGDRKVIFQGPNNDVFQLFSKVLSDPNNTGLLANFISNGYFNTDFNLDGRSIFQGPGNDRSMLLFNTILNHPGNPYTLANYIVLEKLP